MKRFYCAIASLAVLLALGFVTKQLILSRLEPVEQELGLALEALGNSQWDRVQMRVEHFAAAWKDSMHFLGMLLPHDPLEEADSLLQQARLYLENREWMPLSSTLTQLRALISALLDAQKPTLWNLF